WLKKQQARIFQENPRYTNEFGYRVANGLGNALPMAVPWLMAARAANALNAVRAAWLWNSGIGVVQSGANAHQRAWEQTHNADTPFKNLAVQAPLGVLESVMGLYLGPGAGPAANWTRRGLRIALGMAIEGSQNGTTQFANNSLDHWMFRTD